MENGLKFPDTAALPNFAPIATSPPGLLLTFAANSSPVLAEVFQTLFWRVYLNLEFL